MYVSIFVFIFIFIFMLELVGQFDGGCCGLLPGSVGRTEEQCWVHCILPTFILFAASIACMDLFNSIMMHA